MCIPSVRARLRVCVNTLRVRMCVHLRAPARLILGSYRGGFVFGYVQGRYLSVFIT